MKSAVLVVVAVALGSGATGCSILAPHQAVILEVSELVAPATIAPATALDVRLTVVTGGCTYFQRIETDRSASEGEITVWGRAPAKGRDVVCTSDIRYETQSVRFHPPFAPVFTITVHQGEQPPRTATVRVE